MINFKFEEDFRNFSFSKFEEGLFSARITEKCKELNHQKTQLEKYLNDSSQICFLPYNNLINMIPIINEIHKQGNKNEIIIHDNFDVTCNIQLKQELIKALSKVEVGKISHIVDGTIKVKEKILKIKSLYETYQKLRFHISKNQDFEILDTISMIKKELNAFGKEDLEKKLFKHLINKNNEEFENQLLNFKTKKIKDFVDNKENTLQIDHFKLREFFEKIPTDFKEFKLIFIEEINNILLDKMKIEISQQSFKITKFISEKNDNHEGKILNFSILKFEEYQENFPANENLIEKFLLCIEKFFNAILENIEIFKDFPENLRKEAREIFSKKIYEFLKALNLKIYQKKNRESMSNKIKEIELQTNSIDFFKKHFYDFFENAQYDEISVKNKINLLEFKNILFEIMKKIKKEHTEKQLYILLNEKVKTHIESLEDHYLHMEFDKEKQEENKKIFNSFLNYFQLILELMIIFDEEMNEKKVLFYNCMISVLNLTQAGLNKLTQFFLNNTKVKENSFFSMLFKLNKTITNMEIKYLNKMSLMPENSII